MTFIETQISDVKIFEPRVFEDQRGYFFEAYNEKTFFNELGRKPNFCQINESLSKKGTIRRPAPAERCKCSGKARESYTW